MTLQEAAERMTEIALQALDQFPARERRRRIRRYLGKRHKSKRNKPLEPPKDAS